MNVNKLKKMSAFITVKLVAKTEAQKYNEKIFPKSRKKDKTE